MLASTGSQKEEMNETFTLCTVLSTFPCFEDVPKWGRQREIIIPPHPFVEDETLSMKTILVVWRESTPPSIGESRQGLSSGKRACGALIWKDQPVWSSGAVRLLYFPKRLHFPGDAHTFPHFPSLFFSFLGNLIGKGCRTKAARDQVRALTCACILHTALQGNPVSCPAALLAAYYVNISPPLCTFFMEARVKSSPHSRYQSFLFFRYCVMPCNKAKGEPINSHYITSFFYLRAIKKCTLENRSCYKKKFMSITSAPLYKTFLHFYYNRCKGEKLWKSFWERCFISKHLCLQAYFMYFYLTEMPAKFL